MTQLLGRCADCPMRRYPVCGCQVDRALRGTPGLEAKSRYFSSTLAGWPRRRPHRFRVEIDAPGGGPVPFLTGGIGDILALDSWMPPEWRDRATEIALAAPNAANIMKLLGANPAWPTTAFRDLWGDWSSRRAWYSAEEFAAGATAFLRAEDRPLVRRLEDWSIAKWFPRAMGGEWRFRGSTFLRHPVADVRRWLLPERYCLVCPATISLDRRDRHFTPEDWAWAIDRLRRMDMIGVVVNVGDDPVPTDPSLIDLANLTTIEEAVEIARGMAAYIGIDHNLSVLAAQAVPEGGEIHVKSTSEHLYRYAKVYYAPRADFSFVRRSLADESPRWEDHPDCPELEWCPARGVARDRLYFGGHRVHYGDDYYMKYVEYGRTDLGRRIVQARLDLARRYAGRGAVMEYGVGAGTFLGAWMEEGRRGYGHDICPPAVAWLRGMKAFVPGDEPLPDDVTAVCCFDSFEHMGEPHSIFGKIRPGMHLILTLPVPPDIGRMAGWKHRRPGEHLWYWSRAGLARYMADYGFILVHHDRRETELGREDVETFVFRFGAKMRVEKGR